MTGEGKVCAYPPWAQGSPESKYCWEGWLGIAALFGLQGCIQSNCYTTKLLNKSPLVQTLLLPLSSAGSSGEVQSYKFPIFNTSGLLAVEVHLPGGQQNPLAGVPASPACWDFSLGSFSECWLGVDRHTNSYTSLPLAFSACLRSADTIN